MSKVSIIVPIYNVEQYIEKCIKSLMNQTFQEIEILAISDGSPDNSINIVNELAKSDKRIKCIEKENGGYGSVLEYAISIIDTKYFIVCDSDDWLERDAVEKLYNSIENNNVDLVVADRYFVYNDNSSKQYGKVNASLYHLEPNVVYDDLSVFTFLCVTPHSKIYKTEYARNIKFVHKVNYTDTILYLVYLSKIQRALYIDKALSNYFIDRPGNTTEEIDNPTEKSIMSMIKVLDSCFEQLKLENNSFEGIMYYKLYTLSIFTLKMIANFSGNNIEYLNELRDILLKLKPYKKQMKRNIKGNNIFNTIIKKIYFNCILNKHMNRLVLKISLKFFNKKG